MTTEGTPAKPRTTRQQATQQAEQREDEGKQQREARTALIGERVLRALGKPRELLAVQVRPLWEDRYRVNVLVGPDVTCARVAHSYFLAADGGGNITASTPEITRQY